MQRRKKRKEIRKMTKDIVIAQKKNRLATLEANGKNIKCGGVVRKLRRQIRNLEA